MVSSKEIKKIVEKVYTSKKGIKIHPFVYLSIQVPPENIDVNVHPTKEEVFIFLFNFITQIMLLMLGLSFE